MKGLVLALALLGAAACSPKVVTYQVNVVDKSCAGDPPLGAGNQAVTFFQFKVTGDGMAPIFIVVPESAAAAKIPQIPAGTNRVIEVRAYAGDPRQNGSVISVGRSTHFTVPKVVPAPPDDQVTITVFLRTVGEFVPPNLAATPGTCAQMITARAGHTATLLSDGRVYIAGGVQLGAGPGGVPLALDKAEFFDPATGGFVAAKDLAVFNPQDGGLSHLPRAYHTATLLQTGQVMLAGGEEYRSLTGFPLQSVLVFDPQGQDYGGVNLTEPHSHHGAAIEDGGRVLIVGGYTTSGGSTVVSDKVEWFDPQDWAQPDGGSFLQSHAMTDPFPRVGMGVSAVQGGKFIAVAGGSDGTQLFGSVNFFQFDTTSNQFVLSGVKLNLLQSRRQAGIAPFVDPSQLIVAGGYSTPNDAAGVSPVPSSEILLTTQNTVDQGPAVTSRGDICAALLQDGRVLAIGGRTALSPTCSGPSCSDGSVDLITSSPSGGATVLSQAPLQIPRYAHTCTTLADGSVLVLGGIQDNGTTQTVLQDAFIYMPKPLDP